MELHGKYDVGRTDYGERWMAQQAQKEAERAKREKEAEGADGAKKAGGIGEAKRAEKAEHMSEASGKTPVLQDEYISRERSGREIRGIYRRGQDENGNPKILYDDPKKTEEKCIGNTDSVDREIRGLKEKVKQLKQQIRAAGGDEKKVRELEQKLAQAEGELGRKDNDTYRKQHMDIVNG